LNPAISSSCMEQAPEIVHKQPRYSLSWSWSVVKALRGKYTRATDTVCRILGISLQGLVLFLAYDDRMWRILRDWIKNLAELEARTGKYLTDVQIYTWMYECTHRKRTPDVSGRLDKRLEEHTMKEQGSREPASPPSHGAPRPAHVLHTWVQKDLFDLGANRDLVSGESAQAEGQSAQGGADA